LLHNERALSATESALFFGVLMAIPDFQTLMLPLLRTAEDGQERAFKEVVKKIADQYQLTDADLAQLLPSGRAPLFYNRLAWAKTYLKKAGLVELPKRGTFKLTSLGRETLGKKLDRIDLAFLSQFPEYAAVRASGDEVVEGKQTSNDVAAAITPEESIERAYLALKQALADDLLSSIKACSPQFFEHLVVQLMIKMGYGGSREEAGKAVGRSGDGGIDGIINEDRLGLDAIYLQAKRWDGVVGRPEIMKFVGALAGQRATKGVFLTTSWFTQEAKEYATTSQYKVVLVDGVRLADLMIEHDLGVSVIAAYQVRRIDTDFFSEE
jgi:restriction system protein